MRNGSKDASFPAEYTPEYTPDEASIGKSPPKYSIESVNVKAKVNIVKPITSKVAKRSNFIPSPKMYRKSNHFVSGKNTDFMAESDILQGTQSPMRNFPIYKNDSLENYEDGIDTDMAISPIK